MEFKEVKLGEIFYNLDSGEFYQRLNEDIGVVFDLTTWEPYTQNGCTIERNFPPDHVVEELYEQ